MLRSFSKYTGDQVFPGTEGLAQTNSIYPFLDNLTAGGHASSSHGRKIRIISSFANTRTQASVQSLGVRIEVLVRTLIQRAPKFQMLPQLGGE